MNIRQLSDSELADLAANVVDLLTGTELSAIESHVRAELITAFGTLPAELAEEAASRQRLEAEKVAAVISIDSKSQRTITVLNRVRDALKSGVAPAEQFALVGFDVPKVRSGPYVAQDPTGLFATGASNGVNRLTFSGNNRPGSVTYEVWRRQGDTGDWAYNGSTTRQVYIDTPVTPGQFYEYKVRAVAAKTKSHYSNSAVVYGVL